MSRLRSISAVLCASFLIALPTFAAKVANPLGEGVTFQQFIGRFIKGLLGVLGSLALVFFIYGAYWWMVSMGEADKVKKGKRIIIWATLGIVIIFGSYALVTFIFNALTNVQ